MAHAGSRTSPAGDGQPLADSAVDRNRRKDAASANFGGDQDHAAVGRDGDPLSRCESVRDCTGVRPNRHRSEAEGAVAAGDEGQGFCRQVRCAVKR